MIEECSDETHRCKAGVETRQTEFRNFSYVIYGQKAWDLIDKARPRWSLSGSEGKTLELTLKANILKEFVLGHEEL